MAQVVSTEPENPLGDLAFTKEALRFRTMGIQEHAALVQAIMANFPEIYESPVDPNFRQQPGGHSASGPPIQSPAQA